MTRSVLTLLAWAALAAPPALAQAKKGPPLPDPDIKDAKYGPHERNVLDLWKAKADRPTPLLVYIHGGGFRAGDKSSLSPVLLAKCREAGISVAAINYRLSHQAAFPAPMLDGARAVQFLRSKAKDWNLDPARFAANGGSAGAGISLWLAFRDDLADPKADDPVARQSTRLSCVAVQGAQSSYDPRWIKEKIGGRAHEHPALAAFYGLKADEADTPKAHKLYEQASAITYLTKDDPPVFAFYNEPKGPLPADAAPGQGIHHPNFGVALKEKMDALGIECVLRHADDYKGKRNTLPDEMVEFLLKHFKAAPAEAPKRPAAGRLLEQLDRDKDGFLDRSEVPDSVKERFDRIDANGDGKLSKEELERFAGGGQQPAGPGAPPDGLFRRLDANGDGKLSKEELADAPKLLDRLDRNKNGTLEPDELTGPARKGGRPGEVITPAAKGERIPDKLKVGDPAPDFTLPLVTGKGKVTLSDFRGKRPVVLIFASYT